MCQLQINSTKVTAAGVLLCIVRYSVGLAVSWLVHALRQHDIKDAQTVLQMYACVAGIVVVLHHTCALDLAPSPASRHAASSCSFCLLDAAEACMRACMPVRR